jgi:hypothetical protein
MFAFLNLVTFELVHNTKARRLPHDILALPCESSPISQPQFLHFQHLTSNTANTQTINPSMIARLSKA